VALPDGRLLGHAALPDQPPLVRCGSSRARGPAVVRVHHHPGIHAGSGRPGPGGGTGRPPHATAVDAGSAAPLLGPGPGHPRLPHEDGLRGAHRWRNGLGLLGRGDRFRDPDAALRGGDVRALGPGLAGGPDPGGRGPVPDPQAPADPPGRTPGSLRRLRPSPRNRVAGLLGNHVQPGPADPGGLGPGRPSPPGNPEADGSGQRLGGSLGTGPAGPAGVGVHLDRKRSAGPLRLPDRQPGVPALG